jgi:hypothetical protein
MATYDEWMKYETDIPSTTRAVAKVNYNVQRINRVHEIIINLCIT